MEEKSGSGLPPVLGLQWTPSLISLKSICPQVLWVLLWMLRGRIPAQATGLVKSKPNLGVRLGPLQVPSFITVQPTSHEWPATCPPSGFLSCVFTDCSHGLPQQGCRSFHAMDSGEKGKASLGPPHGALGAHTCHSWLLSPMASRHPHKTLPLIPQGLALTNLTRDCVSLWQGKQMEQWTALHDLWDPRWTQQTRQLGTQLHLGQGPPVPGRGSFLAQADSCKS